MTVRGYGTTTTGRASLGYLGSGRRVNWVVAANDGDRYLIRSFTIHWTYYILGY